MAKQVSQSKLDKIAARGEKRFERKTNRKSNRAKKIAARKGISEKEAGQLMKNRKQRRIEKFETAMGIREGVTTQKFEPVRGLAAARAKFQQNKQLQNEAVEASKKITPENWGKFDTQLKNIVSPLTKRTSCKY